MTHGEKAAPSSGGWGKCWGEGGSCQAWKAACVLVLGTVDV